MERSLGRQSLRPLTLRSLAGGPFSRGDPEDARAGGLNGVKYAAEVQGRLPVLRWGHRRAADSGSVIHCFVAKASSGVIAVGFQCLEAERQAGFLARLQETRLRLAPPAPPVSGQHRARHRGSPVHVASTHGRGPSSPTPRPPGPCLSVMQLLTSQKRQARRTSP